MTTAQFVIRCPKHPSNTGLRLREDCEACKIIYRMRGAGVVLHAYDIDREPKSVVARWGAA